MSMTPENNTVSWRGLAGELSAQQIAELEERERDPDSLVRITGKPEYRFDGENLLQTARSYASNNLGAAMIDVPDPAGAKMVYEWSDADSPHAFRQFNGITRTVESKPGDTIDVVIRGLQLADGTVEERGILIYGAPDDNMATAEARRLAAALIAAADEIDGTVSG
jgi:hypothetical protein